MRDVRREAPLYNPAHEHAACGVGFVAHISGRPSHDIVAQAVQAVENLTHRGAVSADAKTGDGAGVLTQLPRRLLAREIAALGIDLQAQDGRARLDPQAEDAAVLAEALAPLAVGMVFLPQSSRHLARCQEIIEEEVRGGGFIFLGWRAVPLDVSALGEQALATMPTIAQCLVWCDGTLEAQRYERRLYLIRKKIERRLALSDLSDAYLASFSARTLLYKGLMVAPQLANFFLDLRDPLYESAFAIFHQRYSTNTFPTWRLAQPFRMLGHNGEINTLQGNVNWMRAREAILASSLWGEEIHHLKPIIQPGGSDSANLDNVLEAVVLSGRDIRHAMMMLIPEAWENMPFLDEHLKAFYEYHACFSEPWDGPAAIAFTDGELVGACLDRNGLRPARYKVTKDGLVVMGSEVGIVDLPDREVIKKGRLSPGEMLVVNTKEQRLEFNDEIKASIVQRQPYAQWVQKQSLELRRHTVHQPGEIEGEEWLLRQQQVFGYSSEELDGILRPMAIDGKEPVGSMGDDTPLAVLSARPRLLSTYFKQKFAQVTNPAIDSLREHIVMSLNTYIGKELSFFEESEEHARLILLKSPILTDDELRTLCSLEDDQYRARRLEAVFRAADGPSGLTAALMRLGDEADQAVADGVHVLVLSDRRVDAAQAPIPMLLAVGSLHHHLITSRARLLVSLIAETGEAREVHHFALLLGYGATAVNPYLAFKNIEQLHGGPAFAGIDLETALRNYKDAIDIGILKIMSKMGISTLSSYRGAQTFEAVGLNRSIIERAFLGTSSKIGGIGLQEITEDVLQRHAQATRGRGSLSLDFGGDYKYRHDGEQHAFTPQIVQSLHAAVRTKSRAAYDEFARLVNRRKPLAPRDLLDFKRCVAIPLGEVEPASTICTHFVTGGMSLGALSPEAHETLAIAMNRMGGMSNSGEGGEDAARYQPRDNGDWPISRVKQVASGRFGVTTEYLVNADQLEIKIAQGSKPGEGGQLPGHKVAVHIAKIRHSVPGVALISPPPHHDIYSIEDLSQLIYDLKQVNPRAKVIVKLVAEAGVGTIAAGVAKGYADIIQISGHDGGTGASPLSSIKHAGVPWELGLAETQQVLVVNNLRRRVRLRTDGGLKTGRDVVIAALLGAEEFGFGTASLVSLGCALIRVCHLNTCPVGVATQREDLRAKFTGTPENVLTYFAFVAQEVREILARLGVRSLGEIIGWADYLEPRPISSARTSVASRHARVDLRPLLAVPGRAAALPLSCQLARNDRPLDPTLDDQLLIEAAPGLDDGTPVQGSYAIRNTHRTVGARLAGEVARRYGAEGLPDGTIKLRFTGSAGQSFGAFCHHGMELRLEGEANDYVGKGMSGGRIIITPPADALFPWSDNTIMGNTVLYGATGGELFAAGRAGERFCVRNSGATAVVEGCGDHGCEYMTGGIAVILGPTGRNFGAGMTSGVAYVLDELDNFHRCYNPELIGLERLVDKREINVLMKLVRRYAAATSSPHALAVLDRWEKLVPRFWRAAPLQAPKLYARTEEGHVALASSASP
ncbi:MAG: glutamate synthase large subunit [Candidatus Tectomicrobia bacterium]|nr:glutamate synthase large subunit [Candidatus Tectomicrobia bacterium]